MAASLGLPGLDIFDVACGEDGSWTWHVASAVDREVCCPGCGRVSGSVVEPVIQRVRHLVVMPVRVVWHKARFRCRESDCGRDRFTETGPLVVAGGRVGEQAKLAMGRLVGDWLVPVSRVAEGAGVAWHTVHDGFERVAAGAGVVVTGTEPCGERVTEPGVSGPAVRAVRSVTGVLPPVNVLGIDDHRRGRPLYHRDPASGAWVADADRWQSVFVDAAGGHGLLGQVEGRAGADVTAWLAARDPAWREAIGYVTIDMSTVYKSAVLKSGLLPNARLIVDLFHVSQLANKMVGDVRRRVTFERYGRRGRATDLEYTIKALLVRGQEKLTRAARHKLLVALADLGDGGRQIGAAWRAKELVRDLLKLSPNQTGVAPTRPQIARALEAFYLFCAGPGAAVPEIVTLAETISTWRAEICRGVATGHSNAAAESVNRLVKLVYRSGYGFTNVTNQQRRSRYAASRGTRPTWLTPQWFQDTARHRHPDQTTATTALPTRQHHPGRPDPPVDAEAQPTHTVITRRTQQVAA